MSEIVRHFKAEPDGSRYRVRMGSRVRPKSRSDTRADKIEGHEEYAHSASKLVPSDRDIHEDVVHIEDQVSPDISVNPTDKIEGQQTGARSASQSLPSDRDIQSKIVRIADQGGTDISVNLTSVIDGLIKAQRRRVFAIKSQSRCDRSCDAFIAYALGYNTDLPPAQRTAIWRRVKDIRKRIEAGKPTIDDEVWSRLVIASAAGRAAFDDLRSHAESEMRRLAKQLPCHAWAISVRGFGEFSLAIIVSEAGNLSNYATKERLWKRLGLAVFDGKSQGRRTNKDEAALHGFNARRRAQIWAQFDSMFKNAAPEYRAIYDRRREQTQLSHPEWDDKANHPGHYHNDAMRVMSKRVIADLWKAWHALSIPSDFPNRAASEAH